MLESHSPLPTLPFHIPLPRAVPLRKQPPPRVAVFNFQGGGGHILPPLTGFFVVRQAFD